MIPHKQGVCSLALNHGKAVPSRMAETGRFSRSRFLASGRISGVSEMGRKAVGPLSGNGVAIADIRTATVARPLAAGAS